MIKQNPVRGMHAIGLAVVDRDPIGIKLCRRVRRARIERGGLPLRYLLRLTEQLGGRGLIEAGLFFQAEDTDRLEQAQRPQPVGVGRVFRRFERNLYVRLRREIVNLVRLGFLHDADDVGCIGDIAVVQMEGNALLVRVVNEMVDALGVE